MSDGESSCELVLCGTTKSNSDANDDVVIKFQLNSNVSTKSINNIISHFFVYSDSINIVGSWLNG